MKLLYEAQNAIEAHLLKGLLEQSGISSRIDGEFLQGGIGELQVFGLVRVMVDDDDFDEALSIVRQWQAQEFNMLE